MFAILARLLAALVFASACVAAWAGASAANGGPDGAIASQRFRNAWHSALGTDASEHWLLKMDGPAPAPRWVEVDGARYALHAFCKPHDCSDNNAVALFEPVTGKVFGLAQRSGRNTLFGEPPPPMAAELQRLWFTEWRAQQK